MESPESFPVVYTAGSEATMHAEFSRQAAKAAIVRPAKRQVAEISVALTRVLDLRDPDLLAALAITREQLVADDPLLPRQLGEAAHYLGFEAVLAPSAAGIGEVLAIFADNRAPTSSVLVKEIRPFEV